MQDNKVLEQIKKVVKNTPKDWLQLTTHRLDIYEEEQAKTQFLEEFEKLLAENNSAEKLQTELQKLPTAYDYIRLGHPLSCVLEWSVAKLNNFKPENVISFQSQSMPLLAILRKNALDNKPTQIVYTETLPDFFDAETIKRVYGYKFDLLKVENKQTISTTEDYNSNASTVFISQNNNWYQTAEITDWQNSAIDFHLSINAELGSILLINGEQNNNYISAIQHVRRRETVAMTPANCFTALQALAEQSSLPTAKKSFQKDKSLVSTSIKEVTGTSNKNLVASSGLSMQYAIMMGLVHDALENHKDKEIKFIVPPNCYGGTNDQARRVAASIENVEVVDLPVDGDNDMVKSIDTILDQIAKKDAVPYIIAEIPTNPRVEVPNLTKLKKVLSTKRQTITGETAIAPVFILDQTFCPNVQFLSENASAESKNNILADVKALSYVSGSKFPSGGKCTAGYCVGNNKTQALINKIEKHLHLCDNEATALQYEILAKQMPSMTQRIQDAYKNTREFVNFIQEVLPGAKINFVTEDLAEHDFTPSVFSLDLPTKGNSNEEKEAYKRALNLKLINLVITEIPKESKFCVSYGQLKGVYWTVPATSTQGTTKEGDKDYIVRVSVAPNVNLERHKEVFKKFVRNI